MEIYTLWKFSVWQRYIPNKEGREGLFDNYYQLGIWGKSDLDPTSFYQQKVEMDQKLNIKLNFKDLKKTRLNIF